MNCCFIVASNNEEVLQSCLLASPDLAGSAIEINVQRGAPSAAVAYNRGIEATRADVMVFVHQDVYLPHGWFQKLRQTLDHLQKQDPNWGVLGLFGMEHNGTGQGHVYSMGLRAMLGSHFEGVRQVETLDEVMLIVRRAANLRFDEALPGFHLYGADICLQADQLGLKSYAMSAACLHNSTSIGLLPKAYWKCYLYLRRKWKSRLPVRTPCMPITRWGATALRYLIKRPFWMLRTRHRPNQRAADPSAAWTQLQKPTAPGADAACHAKQTFAES